MTTQELADKLRQVSTSASVTRSILFDELVKTLGANSVEIEKKRICAFYLWVKEQLQQIGCSFGHGDPDLDEILWHELTGLLILVREILVRELGQELPKARVISPVMEMVEAGKLVASKDADGKMLIAPNEEDPYILTIRVTKVPMGPAPERFRELWVGMELPARRGVPCFDVPKFTPEKDVYVVLRFRAVALMRWASEEAAVWFEENFEGEELFFCTDEAEII